LSTVFSVNHPGFTDHIYRVGWFTENIVDNKRIYCFQEYFSGPPCIVKLFWFVFVKTNVFFFNLSDSLVHWKTIWYRGYCWKYCFIQLPYYWITATKSYLASSRTTGISKNIISLSVVI